MIFNGIFSITRGTKVILAITFSVSVIAIIFAYFYYRGINRSEDPRIEEARKYMLKFEKENGNINSINAFPYLDSAYMIFRSLPDYKSSFEIGVIYINKCSAMLVKALYDSTITDQEKNTLLNLSLNYSDSSITIYRDWINEWGSLDKHKIIGKIEPFMTKDDEAFSDLRYIKVFNRRVKNIMMAQTETPRRLSVSLSNRGIIFRHMIQPDSALNCYRLALSLWKDNRAAESNLSVLIGGEPVKPTLIESLFPPDKNKK